GAELHEHGRRDAVTLADQPEEDVPGTDVVVPELLRFAKRELEHFLRTRRERDVARRHLTTVADDRLDLAAQRVELDPHGDQGVRAEAIPVADEPEEDVLRADVVVAEEARLFLCDNDDAPSPVGEALEHVARLGRARRMLPQSCHDLADELTGWATHHVD